MSDEGRATRGDAEATCQCSRTKLMTVMMRIVVIVVIVVVLVRIVSYFADISITISGFTSNRQL